MWLPMLWYACSLIASAAHAVAQVISPDNAAAESVSASTVITSYVLSPVLITSYVPTSERSDGWAGFSPSLTFPASTGGVSTSLSSSIVLIPSVSNSLGPSSSVAVSLGPNLLVSTLSVMGPVVPSSLGFPGSSILVSSSSESILSESSPSIPRTSTVAISIPSASIVPSTSSNAVPSTEGSSSSSTNAVPSTSTGEISSANTLVIPSGSSSVTPSNSPGVISSTSTSNAPGSGAVFSSNTSTALIPTSTPSVTLSPVDPSVTLATGISTSTTSVPDSTSSSSVTSTTRVPQSPPTDVRTSTTLVVTVTEEPHITVANPVTITTADDAGPTVVDFPITTNDRSRDPLITAAPVSETTIAPPLPRTVLASSMSGISDDFASVLPIIDAWVEKPSPSLQTQAVKGIDGVEDDIEHFIKVLGGELPPSCDSLRKRGLIDGALNIAKDIAGAAGDVAGKLLRQLGCIGKITSHLKDAIEKQDIDGVKKMMHDLIAPENIADTPVLDPTSKPPGPDNNDDDNHNEDRNEHHSNDDFGDKDNGNNAEDDSDDTDDESDEDNGNSSTSTSQTTTTTSCTSEGTVYHVTVLCEPTPVTFGDSTTSTTACYPTTTITTSGCSVTATTTTVTSTPTSLELCMPGTCGSACSYGHGGWMTLSTLDCVKVPTVAVSALPTESQISHRRVPPVIPPAIHRRAFSFVKRDDDNDFIDEDGPNDDVEPVDYDDDEPMDNNDFFDDDEPLAEQVPSDLPAIGEMQHEDLYRVYKFLTANDKWTVVMDDTAVSGEWWPYEPYGEKPARIAIGMPGLYGCTAIFIVSNKGVYTAHFWEWPVFWSDQQGLQETTDEHFKKYTVDALLQGGNEFPDVQITLPDLMGTDERPGPLHPFNLPKVYVITPWSEEGSALVQYPERTHWLGSQITAFLYQIYEGEVPDGANYEVYGYLRTSKYSIYSDDDHIGKVLLDASPYYRFDVPDLQRYHRVGRYRLWVMGVSVKDALFYAEWNSLRPTIDQVQRRDVPLDNHRLCPIPIPSLTSSPIPTPAPTQLCEPGDCGDVCSAGGGAWVTLSPVDCGNIPTTTVTALPTESQTYNSVIDLSIRRREYELLRREDDNVKPLPNTQQEHLIDIYRRLTSETAWFNFPRVSTAGMWFAFPEKASTVLGIKGLYGCTSVIIVSSKGVYISHIWEKPTFINRDEEGRIYETDEEYFKKYSFDALTQGGEEFDNVEPISSLVGTLANPGPLHPKNTPRVFVVTHTTEDGKRLEYEYRVSLLAELFTAFLYQSSAWGIPQGADGQTVGYQPGPRDLAEGDNAHWGKVILEVSPIDHVLQAGNQHVAVGRYRLWVSGTRVDDTEFWTFPHVPAQVQQRDVSYNEVCPMITSSSTASPNPSTFITTTSVRPVNPPGQPPGFTLPTYVPPKPTNNAEGTLSANMDLVSERICFEEDDFVPAKLDQANVEDVAELCRDGQGPINDNTMLGPDDERIEYSLASGNSPHEEPWYVVDVEWVKGCEGPAQNVHHPMVGRNCHQLIVDNFSMKNCKTKYGYGGSIVIGCLRYTSQLRGGGIKGVQVSRPEDLDSSGSSSSTESGAAEPLPSAKSLVKETVCLLDSDPINIKNDSLVDELIEKCEGDGISKHDMSLGPSDKIEWIVGGLPKSTEIYYSIVSWEKGCEGPNQNPVTPMVGLTCKDITKKHFELGCIRPGNVGVGGTTVVGCLRYQSYMGGYPLGELHEGAMPEA
ncbi:hypothetical protein AN6134.2 [Aspergillus nidulans FGSC A4]|uniref:Uncharacterized protein n=1 Tax=Emericella nidulans (strain FGSC A4 / ATCC 38163 / CBS 112.46 / NRRL 194 / M139) TaxID=227321 RepID=Q5AZZ6_EMENI|nr:hypothetical protein [Aspergillus nidulans FGSC A4]EAA57920.1 hypothetical protein AN6134.2 [Aspergillus nidulans FGSC A4]CBF70112.1 TPA: conserved hypothetical protein [Aspergillus nidulans FGSC A4]|eukprot:XP_663738.1 hypothetical protein AN6134.2 [Aspergillus nidulans FGSC A4]